MLMTGGIKQERSPMNRNCRIVLYLLILKSVARLAAVALLA